MEAIKSITFALNFLSLLRNQHQIRQNVFSVIMNISAQAWPASKPTVVACVMCAHVKPLRACAFFGAGV